MALARTAVPYGEEDRALEEDLSLELAQGLPRT